MFLFAGKFGILRPKPLGNNALRCQWQMKQSVVGAAVEKNEGKRKPDDFFGHRKTAAKLRMPGVRVSPLGP